MKGKKVIIIQDAPRISRYVFTVITPDNVHDHYTTGLAAFRAMLSKMDDMVRTQIPTYSQVMRKVAKYEHYTVVDKDRKVWQLKRVPVMK